MTLYYELEFPFDKELICDKIDELFMIGKMMGYEVNVEHDFFDVKLQWIVISVIGIECEYTIRIAYEHNKVGRITVFEHHKNNFMYSGLELDKLIKAINKVIKKL